VEKIVVFTLSFNKEIPLEICGFSYWTKVLGVVHSFNKAYYKYYENILIFLSVAEGKKCFPSGRDYVSSDRLLGR